MWLLDTPRGVAQVPDNITYHPAWLAATVKEFAGTNLRNDTRLDGTLVDDGAGGYTVIGWSPECAPYGVTAYNIGDDSSAPLWYAPGFGVVPAENVGTCNGVNNQYFPNGLPASFSPPAPPAFTLNSALTDVQTIAAARQLAPGYGWPLIDYANGQWASTDAWLYAPGEERYDAFLLRIQALLVGMGLNPNDPIWVQSWNLIQKLQDRMMKANADAAHGFVNVLAALPIMLAPLMAFFAAEVMPVLLGSGALGAEAATAAVDAVETSAFAAAPEVATSFPTLDQSLQVVKAFGNIAGAGDPSLKPYISAGNVIGGNIAGALTDGGAAVPVGQLDDIDYSTFDVPASETFPVTDDWWNTGAPTVTDLGSTYTVDEAGNVYYLDGNGNITGAEDAAGNPVEVPDFTSEPGWVQDADGNTYYLDGQGNITGAEDAAHNAIPLPGDVDSAAVMQAAGVTAAQVQAAASSFPGVNLSDVMRYLGQGLTLAMAFKQAKAHPGIGLYPPGVRTVLNPRTGQMVPATRTVIDPRTGKPTTLTFNPRTGQYEPGTTPGFLSSLTAGPQWIAGVPNNYVLIGGGLALIALLMLASSKGDRHAK